MLDENFKPRSIHSAKVLPEAEKHLPDCSRAIRRRLKFSTTPGGFAEKIISFVALEQATLTDATAFSLLIQTANERNEF